MEDIIDSSANC